MTSNVLPLHFAPNQASSSQNSNVDSYLQNCEVDSLKPSKSESSLPQPNGTVLNQELNNMLGTFFVHSNNMNWHFMLGIFDISGINSFVVIVISVRYTHQSIHCRSHNITLMRRNVSYTPCQNVWSGSKSVVTFGLIKILTHPC